MTEKPKTVDFGAPATFGAHLFRVEIPASRNEPVVIVEDYGYRGQEGGIPRDEERVVLKRPVWSAIADIARREFNDRLKAAKVLTGRWHTGTQSGGPAAGQGAVRARLGRRDSQPRSSSPSSAASGRRCARRSAGGSLP